MQTFWKKLAARLSRITTSGKYFPLIDGLRFLAIAPVIVQHMSERLIRHTPVEFVTPIKQDQLAFLASRGTVGVFIFFAISGFMLSLPFARHQLRGAEKPSIKHYFIRRFTRIEPPYLIWMTVFALVLLVKGTMSLGEMVPHWFASCFYFHNLAYGEYSIINPVAWSLEIEIQFYLIAPWIVQLFFSIKNDNARQWILWASILGFISLQHGMGWQYFPYKATLLGQLQHFLVGIWLADCFLTRWGKTVKPQAFWDFLFPPALLVMAYTWTEEYAKSLLFALALATVFTAAFKGRFFNKIFQLKWIATIGGMCYTIYLIHLPLMELQMGLTKNITLTNFYLPNLFIQLALGVPVILAISGTFFLILERPFMRKDWINVLTTGWNDFSFTNTLSKMLSGKSSYKKLALKMKKITALLSAFLLSLNIAVAQDDYNNTYELPPLDTLIKRALEVSPALRSQDIWIETQKQSLEVQRKSWADLVAVGGTALLGTNNVLDYQQTTTNSEYISVDRRSAVYNAGVTVRLSLGDIMNRGDKNKLKKLEWERAQSDRSIIENQIIEEVIRRYGQFLEAYKMMELETRHVESQRIAFEVADKYFKAGNLPVSEYSTVASQKIAAEKLLEESKLGARQAYFMLMEMTRKRALPASALNSRK